MPPYSFLWDLPTQIFRLSSKPSHKPISIHSVKGRSVHQFIDRFKTFTVYIHTPTKKNNKDLFLALDTFDKDQTWSTLKTQEYLKDAFPWLAAPPLQKRPVYGWKSTRSSRSLTCRSVPPLWRCSMKTLKMATPGMARMELSVSTRPMASAQPGNT